MKILFAAAECAPIAKVGGLGDVVGSLPKTLNQLGADARIILPFYKTTNRQGLGMKAAFFLRVSFNQQTRQVKIFQTRLPHSRVILYLVEEPEFFGQGGIYENADASAGGEKEILKFLFFCSCVNEFLKTDTWHPDLLHLHDWHVAAATLLSSPALPTLLTVHNLAMQGKASLESLKACSPNLASLPSVKQDLLKSGKVNLLRQGILRASAVNTVSPAYAREISETEFSEGLKAELKARKVTGIINGIDETVWNTTNDPFITSHYTRFSARLKQKNKAGLLAELGLKVNPKIPLIGIVSRLTGQKGFDLLLPIKAELETLPCQLAVLGVGEPKLEKLFADLARDIPDRFVLIKKFSEQLAHRIYAACDIFLMPSRFEPCGLGQMIAMHYGAVPVVHAVGGLKDTVINLNENCDNLETARGFQFDKLKSASLLRSLKRALALWQNDPVLWQRLQRNAMNAEFSWTGPAREYLKLYKKLVRV